MRLRTTLTVLCLLAAALFVAPAARAAEIRNGDRVVIAAGEVIDDDLIVSAETVIIDGTVTGDLIATGTNVTLNGLVQGSALLAGQTLRVAGQVDGSLYAGGYAVTLDEGAVVGRNAYFGGYSVATRPDSLVGAGLPGRGTGSVTVKLAPGGASRRARSALPFWVSVAVRPSAATTMSARVCTNHHRSVGSAASSPSSSGRSRSCATRAPTPSVALRRPVPSR